VTGHDASLTQFSIFGVGQLREEPARAAKQRVRTDRRGLDATASSKAVASKDVVLFALDAITVHASSVAGLIVCANRLACTFFSPAHVLSAPDQSTILSG
jgi:hypothetical protein